MRKIRKEKIIQHHKRYKLIITVVLMIVISFSLVQVYVSNRLVAAGEKVKRLEIVLEKLNLENESLQKEIMTETSLTKIKEKTEAIGMVTNPKLIHIGIPESVVMKK